MFDTNLDRIHVQLNSMDIVLYCIVLCNDNQENDFYNHRYNCKISRKNFVFECMYIVHHMDLYDRMVKNCIHDSRRNLSSMQMLCGNGSTMSYASFPFSVAVYYLDEHLLMVNQLLLFDKIHIPKWKEIFNEITYFLGS